MFSFDFRKTSAWDYQRHLLRPWPTVTVTLHLDHDYVPCGPRLRWFWAIVPFDVDRDYAMWATITVKHKMRPTSQRNPGPHHNGISGPHPMESPAHIDRNTHNPHSINHFPPENSWHSSYAPLDTLNIWIKSIEGSFDRAETDLRRPLAPLFLNRISHTESIF